MKIEIAGKEYKLRTDNEKVLKLAAELVNSEILALESALPGESQNTLAVLAALNIAEKYFLSNSQSELDKEFMKNELTRMTEQINIQINDGAIQTESKI